jgi:hypothetical protein
MVGKGHPRLRVSRRSGVIGFGQGRHFGGERDAVAHQHRKHALTRAAGLPASNVLPPRRSEQSVERLFHRGDVSRLEVMRRAGRRVV